MSGARPYRGHRYTDLAATGNLPLIATRSGCVFHPLCGVIGVGEGHAARKGARRMAPNFIIGGAPKCGTTTLHQVLDQHPDIWVARNEVYHFDADDPVAHGDFLKIEQGELCWRDPNDPQVRAWYDARFADAPEGALIGEDTTTYLMSAVAPARIKAANPEVKLIFMLRDPVKRAFSQYWHLLRSGRTSDSFEKTLTRHPSILLGSTYAPALREFRDVFGPEQVHVVIFEDFNANRQAVLDGVTAFLGVSDLVRDDMPAWHNRTKYPAQMKTLLRLNRVGRVLVRARYARHLGQDRKLSARLAHAAYRRWFGFVSRRVLTEDQPPSPMRAKTRAYLCQHLSDRNAGLSALIDKDLSRVWPGFSQ